MNQNPTAVIYARVSTTRQADDGLPIDSQVEHGYRKAELLSATVVNSFVDAGISGRTDERPAFREAITYCKTYGVDYFICWSTSRFARNKLDAALYKRELEKAGTRVIYVSVDLDNRTDSGWMMESILEIFDEHYSRQVSTDTLRSMLKNARDGFFNGGVVPFGYTTVPAGKRKKLTINEVEALTVREMFRHYVAGIGCKSIAMLMNEQLMLNRGRKWNKTTVTNLLKNEVYLGRVIFNRENHKTRTMRPRNEWIITQSHEPLIDEDDFMSVQQMFADRAPREGGGSAHSHYVFTGLLKCKQCGSSMQIESSSGRSQSYHYYNCRAAQKGSGCVHRRLSAEALDMFLIDAIMDKVLTREMIQETVIDLHELAGGWIKDRDERRATLKESIQACETRLRNLYEVLELHGKEAPNLGDLTTRMRELRTQRDEAERKLLRLEEEQAPSLLIHDTEVDEMAALMRDVVMTTKDEKKLRQFFSTFIKTIVVGEKDVRIEYSAESIVNHAKGGTVHSDAIWLPNRVLLRTKSINIALPARFIKIAA
jgi:site-specific DNA recombinase